MVTRFKKRQPSLFVMIILILIIIGFNIMYYQKSRHLTSSGTLQLSKKTENQYSLKIKPKFWTCTAINEHQLVVTLPAKLAADTCGLEVYLIGKNWAFKLPHACFAVRKALFFDIEMRGQCLFIKAFGNFYFPLLEDQELIILKRHAHC